MSNCVAMVRGVDVFLPTSVQNTATVTVSVPMWSAHQFTSMFKRCIVGMPLSNKLVKTFPQLADPKLADAIVLAVREVLDPETASGIGS